METSGSTVLGHFEPSLPRRCPYCRRALSARERHRILMDRLRATPTDLPSVLAHAIHAAHA